MRPPSCLTLPSNPTGAGAPPPARTDADTFTRISLSSLRCGRRRPASDDDEANDVSHMLKIAIEVDDGQHEGRGVVVRVKGDPCRLHHVAVDVHPNVAF